MAHEEVIRDAIRKRSPLLLCYEDDAGPPRTVHPHVLYVSARGKTCVDTYQVDGPTSDGAKLPAWRPFDLARVTSVQATTGEFALAPGLNLSSAKYRNGILAHV